MRSRKEQRKDPCASGDLFVFRPPSYTQNKLKISDFMDDLTYRNRDEIVHDLYRTIKDQDTLDLVASALMKAQGDAGGSLSYDDASAALTSLVYAKMIDSYTPKYVLKTLYGA